MTVDVAYPPGFKGIVAVDERLEGVCMRLRPSMDKFQARDESEAEIEIAKAFVYPGTARLCLYVFTTRVILTTSTNTRKLTCDGRA